MSNYFIEMACILTILVILLLILLIGSFFGDFRNRFSRESLPKMVEISTSKNDDLHIILVHGTYAKDAPWTFKNSKIINFLEKNYSKASLHRLVWSGDNHHGIRMQAAKIAVDWINRLPTNSKVVLIGHSHGGTIAANISGQIKDNSNIFVIAMACPFVVAYPKFAGLNSKNLDLESDDAHNEYAFSAFFLALCLVHAFSISQVFSLEFSDSFYALSALALFWLILMKFLGKSVKDQISELKLRSMNICNQTAIFSEQEKTLLLRTPGDEASGLLAMAHFSAWLARLFISVFNKIAILLREIENYSHNYLGQIESSKWWFFGCFLGLTMFVTKSESVLFFSPLFLTLFLLRFKVISSTIEGFLLCLLFPLNVLAHLPFGFDIARLGPLLSVSVEASPPGNWNLTLMRPDPNAFLSHSVSYNSSETFEKMEEWLNTKI